jgi:hypothetical protein
MMMFRILFSLFVVLLFGVERTFAAQKSSQPSVSLLKEQRDCLYEKSHSSIIAKVDFETAAYEVMARCRSQSDAYFDALFKSFPGGAAEFAKWRDEVEARDLRRVKEWIATFRTD